MDSQNIVLSAERLAHVVIISFKSEHKARSWLEANKISTATNDRVVNLAMSIVKDTLRDEHFSLKEYKLKFSKTCNS
jgi:hypothetical protein